MPISELERKRVEEGYNYRHPSLITKILRIRHLAEFVEDKARDMGGVDKALSFVDSELERMGGDKGKISLFAFWRDVVCPHRKQEGV